MTDFADPILDFRHPETPVPADGDGRSAAVPTAPGRRRFSGSGGRP